MDPPLNLSHSTNNESSSVLDSNAGGLIRADLVQMITKIIVTVDIFLALAGVVANCFNVAVFWKIGLAESTNLTFFSLSLADLGVTFFMFIGMINRSLSFLYQETQLWFEIQPFFLYLILSNTGVAIMASSVLLTTFMAVQRCCCVVLPFRFKSLFTRKRAIYIIVSIFLFTLVFVFGYTCLYGAKPALVQGTNRTNLQLFRRHFRDKVLASLSMVDIFCVKVPCQVIVFICVLAMHGGLRRSLEFRQNSTSTSGASGQNKTSKDTMPSTAEKASASEAQLIKSVILVSTVFIFCNTPSILIVITDDFVPELSNFGRYKNLFSLVFVIRQFCELFSSSFNFVIYISVNRKFKETMDLLLKRHKT